MAEKSNEGTGRDFNVPPEVFEHFRQFYDKEILPRIKEKDLANIITIVEDMINEKKSKDNIQKNGSSTERRYRIVLSFEPYPPLMDFSYGVVIVADPTASEENIRISIYRQLGVLLREYGLFAESNTGDFGGLLDYFASGGK